MSWLGLLLSPSADEQPAAVTCSCTCRSLSSLEVFPIKPQALRRLSCHSFVCFRVDSFSSSLINPGCQDFNPFSLLES